MGQATAYMYILHQVGEKEVVDRKEEAIIVGFTLDYIEGPR